MNKFGLKVIGLTIWAIMLGYVFGHALGSAVAESDWVNGIITSGVMIASIAIISMEWNRRQSAAKPSTNA